MAFVSFTAYVYACNTQTIHSPTTGQKQYVPTVVYRSRQATPAATLRLPAVCLPLLMPFVYGLCTYLEGDDDGLEVATPPLDVVAHLLHVDVVQRSVDLVHDEEGGWSEAACKRTQKK